MSLISKLTGRKDDAGHFNGKPVRKTIQHDSLRWAAEDVAAALEIEDSAKALAESCSDETIYFSFAGNYLKDKTRIITTGEVFCMIPYGKEALGKRFEQWIFKTIMQGNFQKVRYSRNIDPYIRLVAEWVVMDTIQAWTAIHCTPGLATLAAMEKIQSLVQAGTATAEIASKLRASEDHINLIIEKFVDFDFLAKRASA